MQLSQKQIIFCACFFLFSKSTLNFKNFQKKNDPYNSCICENMDPEKRA